MLDPAWTVTKPLLVAAVVASASASSRVFAEAAMASVRLEIASARNWASSVASTAHAHRWSVATSAASGGGGGMGEDAGHAMASRAPAPADS
jgi:hypothetical protein